MYVFVLRSFILNLVVCLSKTMDIDVFWFAELNYVPQFNVKAHLKPGKEVEHVFLCKILARLNMGLTVTKGFELI